MSVSLAIEFTQLKSLITQCNIEEKVEIVRLLEKETFPTRLNRLLAQFKTNELTLAEITEEVETVRQRRYNAKK